MQATYPDRLDRHEAAVIDTLVIDALAQGFTVSVNDGEEWSVKLSRDHAAIAAAVGVTEITRIRVCNADEDLAADFFFVHGNLPSEVINDLTDTEFAHGLIARAEIVARDLEARGL